MKTEWDYTKLADAYLKRPNYSSVAIQAMMDVAGVRAGDEVIDIGAGVGHLTRMLADADLKVTAVEPNDAMRANGIKRTSQYPHVKWLEGTGEQTGQSGRAFRLVTFGSSFNVCNRKAALQETARLLQPGCWFACMWNHRDLTDPTQRRIEEIISKIVPDYSYGTRREDQVAIIDSSGLFGPVVHMSSRIIQMQPITECVEAWRSHATLERQAGNAFGGVVKKIEEYLDTVVGGGNGFIKIPYTTNIWIAQCR